MRLQKRVFAMIMGIQLLFLILMSITTSYRTMTAFTSTERRFLEQRMARFQAAVDAEVRQMQGFITDWGAWDSMYAFMATKDVQRFDELLNGSILRAMNVDFLAVLDNDLNIVVSYFVNELGDEVPLLDHEKDLFREQVARRLFAAMNEGPEAFGGASPNDVPEFMKLGDEIYLVRSTQILTTNWTGPSRGMVVAGMDFAKNLEAISSSLETPCNFIPLPPPPEGVSYEPGDVVIQEMNDDAVSVWQTRSEVLGADVPYVLSFSDSRYIYAEGKRAMYNSYIWLFYNGVSLAFLMMYFLSQTILKRLSRLRSTADEAVTKLDLNLRVVATRDDEIGDLVKSFNTLFETLGHLMMDIPDALILTDTSNNIIFLNHEGRKLLKKPNFSRDTDTININDILKREDSKVLSSSSNAQSIYEATIIRQDGTSVPVELHESSIVVGNQRDALYLARDLSERKNLEARIDWNDHHDAYTGLPNRKSFVDTLNNLLKPYQDRFTGAIVREDVSVKPIIIVLINMDHFKSINAEVSNAGGDIILAVIAGRIANILDGRGQLYRTSGDEFVILFQADEDGHMISTDELMSLLYELRDNINLPYQMGDRTVYPSASMGVLPNALSYGDPSLIIEKATTALKAAKRSGLGVINFYKEDAREIDVTFNASVLRMRYEIQDAVAKDQFIPYFQPVYSITDRRLSGFETLVRWQHPKRGFLAPGSFIPYAERIGLVGDIDQCMMRCAMKAIEDSPAPLYFSANGSSSLMQRRDAADVICSFLDKIHVEGSRFVLEVTESVLIDNLAEVRQTLDQLGHRDIKIFLDDFGTGYSSLQYLHSLPFNCIKLDQSFVRRIFDSDQDAKMLRAIINMANTLGMDTIAEGVETVDQLSWLEDAGCHKAQGYYFAKPLPWSEAEALIIKEVNGKEV